MVAPALESSHTQGIHYSYRYKCVLYGGTGFGTFTYAMNTFLYKYVLYGGADFGKFTYAAKRPSPSVHMN